MSTPEFSRMIDRRGLTAEPLLLEADQEERAALAKRFELVAIDLLHAEIELEARGEVVFATGALTADIVQSCAVSGEDLPVHIREDLLLRFVPAGEASADPDVEVELDEEDLDEIPYSGTSFDLGEAVAQSLALAIDPFAIGPAAEEARRRHGLLEEGAAGPLAEALRGLKGE